MLLTKKWLNVLNLVIFFLFSNLCFSQSKDKALNVIGLRYNEIVNNIDNYKKTELMFPGETTDNNILRIFKKDNQVKKMHAEFYNKQGYVSEEYFFWNDMLILVNVNKKTYDAPASTRNYQILKDENETLYFYNEKIVKWNKDETEYFAKENQELLTVEKQYIDSSKKLLAKIK